MQLDYDLLHLQQHVDASVQLALTNTANESCTCASRTDCLRIDAGPRVT